MLPACHSYEQPAPPLIVYQPLPPRAPRRTARLRLRAWTALLVDEAMYRADGHGDGEGQAQGAACVIIFRVTPMRYIPNRAHAE